MMTSKKESPNRISLANTSPLLADVIATALYIILLPSLTILFQKKSILSTVLVGTVYLLFCVCVWVIRKLPTETKGASQNKRGFLAFLGISFGIFVTYIMAESSGLLDRLDSMSMELDTQASIFLFVGSILWFGLVSLYAIILMVDIRPALRSNKLKTETLSLLCLLGINVMILVTVSYWDAFFSGSEPYEGLALGGKILIFLPTYAFFLFFFAPPRMLFLIKKPSKTAVFTFILQTAYYVWNSLSGTAWK